MYPFKAILPFLSFFQLSHVEKTYNAPAKVTLIFLIHVCVCVQIFRTHSCMHTYVCAGTCEGQTLTSVVFFNCSSPYSLKQALSLSESEKHRLSYTCWPASPNILLSSPALGLQRDATHMNATHMDATTHGCYTHGCYHILLCFIFNECWGTKRRPSILPGKHLTTESSPQPSVLLRKPWAKHTNTCSFLHFIYDLWSLLHYDLGNVLLSYRTMFMAPI